MSPPPPFSPPRARMMIFRHLIIYNRANNVQNSSDKYVTVERNLILLALYAQFLIIDRINTIV